MSSMKVDDLKLQFETILASAYPPFIYVQDLSGANVAREAMDNVLDHCLTDELVKPAVVFVDCISCFSHRLIFDTILNTLIKHRHTEEFSEMVRNDSMDDFLHNLCGLFRASSSARQMNIVIIFEHAEKLKEMNPRLIHPLSRLRELVALNLVTVFVSTTEWEHLATVAGTLLDPYRITIDPLGKEETIARIQSAFPSDVGSDALNIYNPLLLPLFSHYVEAVCNVCFPFTTDPKELAYIVCARWPGFASPIVEDWKLNHEAPFPSPTEEIRLRLIRLFNPSLTSAIETLYPRSTERTEWSMLHSMPEGTYLTQPQGLQLSLTTSLGSEQKGFKLTTLAMFVIVASFLASYNPAKTDYRMFGRGYDEGRKRKKGGGTRRIKTSTVAKLPQRLVGPMAFTYERLIAILGSLLREYDMNQDFDAQSELNAEMEVHRSQTAATVRELVACKYIHRATMQEKLESISYRCGLGHEQVLILARKLGVPLTDLMWEPN